jgi:hypothetical protein
MQRQHEKPEFGYFWHSQDRKRKKMETDLLKGLFNLRISKKGG